MSSVRFVTRLTRTPEGRLTLNSVTVGPLTQPTTSARMPKSSSVSCSRAAVSDSSSSLAPWGPRPFDEARSDAGGSS